MVEAGRQLDVGTGARRGFAAADHDDDNHNHDTATTPGINLRN
jgi:hypothetical protein